MSMFSSKTGTTESSAKDLDRVRLAKQKKPKKTKEKAVRKVARTVQDTIPYEHVHGKYNFEVEKNRYSVTYSFSDVTYDAADAAEQERIFLAYGDLLNSFDTSDDIQITLHNNVINQKEFSSQILLKHAGDGFDEYRDEYNEMLLDKMQQGQNGITTKKYFTVTVTAATLELAQQKLAAKELYMRSCFQKIGSNIEKLKANERIRIIADIFRGVNQEIRPISSSEFLRGAEKSLCCPDYFEFKKDYFMYNDKFARMVYLKHLPSSLVDDMLKDLCETSLPIVVTVNIAPVEPSEAIKVVKRQLTAMRSNKMQKEKKASQHGVYSDVISDDLKQSLAEAEELLNDLQSKNQKMFLLNLVVMVTGTSFDELDNNTDKIEAVFRKHVCTTSRANFQQEDAMASCLPLGNCRLKVRRTLTTESACVFMPFNSKELSQKGGVYYGLNQTTNNLIIFNRASLINANGFILGCPGSGKRYTESSLLKAMENIDRRIEDKELSGYVSERGLGTPATRAAIIEKILADGYAERKNKVISATEMGIKMINFVPSEVKSVEMTAAMELQLATIENGTASADEVISSITEKIKAIIEAEKHRAHTPVAEPRTVQRIPVGKCPKCGGNVYKFVRDNTGIFYCEKAPKDCIFRVYEDDYFFTSKGKKLTEPMMKNLLSHGEVKVSGFKSEKTGNTYNAVVSFADRTDKNGNAKIGFTMRFEDKTKR